MGADVHQDLVGVRQPVEVSPDFTTSHFFRAVGGWQQPEGFDSGNGHADMSVVFVGEVVGVHDLRPGRRQNLE